jgi:DNA-binding SARP family transcriptional activator/Tfp pilus assembly protein PilF
LPPRLFALIGYLAAASPGSAVRRDVLLATFWPDADIESARSALNQAIYEVRQYLGRDMVESRGKAAVVLGLNVSSDVRDFSVSLSAGRRTHALQLYGGELLEGLHISRAWPFEQWLDETRYRLRMRASAAAAAEAAAEHDNGRIAPAISWLTRAFDLDSANELLGRRLIALHLESGNRSAAVHVYRRLMNSLQSELDLETEGQTLNLATLEMGSDCPPARCNVPSSTDARRIARDLLDRAGELVTADRTANAIARELLSQATRIDPQLVPARTAYACALSEWVQLFGGPREAARLAVAEADTAVRIGPTSVDAHLARGCGLEALTRFRDAAEAFRAVLQIHPGHREAVSRYGRALMYAGDVAGSRILAGNAAHRHEDDPDLLLQLGMADFVLNRDDEAREATASALHLRPGFHYAEAAWAFYELVHGHFDEAAATLQRFLSRDPDSFMGHFFHGDLALVQRDFATALASYQRCYDIDPAGRPVGLHLSAQAQLGFVHVKAGDAALGHRMLDAAETDVRRALNAGAEFGGFLVELAITAASRGDERRAVDHLTTAYRTGYLQHHLIRRHPAFDQLVGRPDFRGLLATVERDVERQAQRI